MDLRSTILGLLSWKALSGYDLKRIISGSEVFYWSGNNNQIYKNLLDLQKEDLVTHQVQLQETLPAKKIYSITEAGLAALRQSLLLTPELPETRKTFLIQIAWAEILSDEELDDLFALYEEEISSQLRMHQAQASVAINGPARSQREAYLWERIAANTLVTTQAELDWVRQTRQGLRERAYLEQKQRGWKK